MKHLYLTFILSCFVCSVFAQIPTLQQVTNAGNVTNADLVVTGNLKISPTNGTNGFETGNADNATYTGNNFYMRGWYGMGMRSYDNAVNGFYNFRTGTWDVKNGYWINGGQSALYSDATNTTLYATTGAGLLFATDGNQKMMIKKTGEVGIGTSTPNARLEVAPPSSGANAGLFHLTGGQAWGHVVTLATDNPTGDDARLLLSYRGGNKKWAIGGFANTNSTNARFSIWEDAGDGNYGTGFGDERFTVMPGGNVGIGTGTPGTFKLAVNGTIRAKEIKVETGWSDYVFYKNYNLLPLSKVSSFINANKHLPDVPSAAEVEANGIDLGKTNALLLKKIEELTLYLIDQNKELANLKKRMASQERLNKRLFKKIARP
ncbi:hypothetical protein [Mucilaginibacter sp.]|uniref:hypothetical protein n=1 Tax=Mucilaginibacter sp. TaxID=1882438 RepID=UPI0035BC7392